MGKSLPLSGTPTPRLGYLQQMTPRSRIALRPFGFSEDPFNFKAGLFLFSNEGSCRSCGIRVGFFPSGALFLPNA
jgi:hypothetical protein